MHSRTYLESVTIQGEIELALLDWSDEAQEDLILVAMNDLVSPDFETCMRLWSRALLETCDPRPATARMPRTGGT